MHNFFIHNVHHTLETPISKIDEPCDMQPTLVNRSSKLYALDTLFIVTTATNLNLAISLVKKVVLYLSDGRILHAKEGILAACFRSNI